MTQSTDQKNEEITSDPPDASDTATASLTPSSNAAAAAVPSPTLAEALYTVETLMQVFGFSADAANQAVNEVGTDIQQCCTFILEHGLGHDTGGAIYPIDNCPHATTTITTNEKATKSANTTNLDSSDNMVIQITVQDLEQMSPTVFHKQCSYHSSSNKAKVLGGGGESLKGETLEDGSCPMGENWLCLTCGQVFCSRYINGHGLKHWKDTTDHPDKTANNTVKDPNTTSAYGHCVAVSLADLSVWCHVCQAYLVHDPHILKPLIDKLEALKFPTASP